MEFMGKGDTVSGRMGGVAGPAEVGSYHPILVAGAIR